MGTSKNLASAASPLRADLSGVRLFMILLCSVLIGGVAAQTETPDPTPVVDTVAAAAPILIDGAVLSEGDAITDTLDWRGRHSPRRATILSAVLPGAGQIYNHKYWKAPIVWAGLGVSYGFIQRNTREYRRYKDAYIAVVDGDPTTVDEFNGRISASQLLDVTNTYRKWRDLSYIAIGAVYILNIVDASVDANFVRFDVGRDLSLAVAPSLELASMGTPGLTLGFTLR